MAVSGAEAPICTTTLIFLDRQEQKFHGQIKIHVAGKSSLGSFQCRDNIPDTLVGASVRYLSNILYLVSENQVIRIICCLKHQCIPIPDQNYVQIVINIELIFRNFLNGLYHLTDIQVIDILQQCDSLRLDIVKLLTDGECLAIERAAVESLQ